LVRPSVPFFPPVPHASEGKTQCSNIFLFSPQALGISNSPCSFQRVHLSPLVPPHGFFQPPPHPRYDGWSSVFYSFLTFFCIDFSPFPVQYLIHQALEFSVSNHTLSLGCLTTIMCQLGWLRSQYAILVGYCRAQVKFLNSKNPIMSTFLSLGFRLWLRNSYDQQKSWKDNPTAQTAHLAKNPARLKSLVFPYVLATPQGSVVDCGMWQSTSDCQKTGIRNPSKGIEPLRSTSLG